MKSDRLYNAGKLSFARNIGQVDNCGPLFRGCRGRAFPRVVNPVPRIYVINSHNGLDSLVSIKLQFIQTYDSFYAACSTVHD